MVFLFFATESWLAFPIAQLNNFQIFKSSPFHSEANKRAFLMPSLKSGCSRIDVQAIERAVVKHFEDV